MQVWAVRNGSAWSWQCLVTGWYGRYYGNMNKVRGWPWPSMVSLCLVIHPPVALCADTAALTDQNTHHTNTYINTSTNTSTLQRDGCYASRNAAAACPPLANRTRVSFFRSIFCLFIRSFIRSFVRLLFLSFVRLFFLSFVRSVVLPFGTLGAIYNYKPTCSRWRSRLAATMLRKCRGIEEIGE